MSSAGPGAPSCWQRQAPSPLPALLRAAQAPLSALQLRLETRNALSTPSLGLQATERAAAAVDAKHLDKLATFFQARLSDW